MSEATGRRVAPWLLGALAIASFVVGGASGMLIQSAWPVPLHAVSAWAYAFSTSAGLGGVAALIAAVIAYRGVTRSADTSRKTALEAAATARQTALDAATTTRHTALESQWWENARWAADRLLSASDITEGSDSYGIELAAEVTDDASANLLVDQGAYAAIIMLQFLGENAPSENARYFAMDVLGTVLGIASVVDNGEKEQAGHVGDRQPDRNDHGEADL